jgi:sec-independent protein translocase protein TatA
MLGGLGFPELIVILVIAALIFGPGRLPELGEGLGKAIREFQRSVRAAKDEVAKGQLDDAGQNRRDEDSAKPPPTQTT